MTGSIEPFARKRGVTMIRKINSSDFSARPASIIPRAWISHSSAELPITVNNTLLLGSHKNAAIWDRTGLGRPLRCDSRAWRAGETVVNDCSSIRQRSKRTFRGASIAHSGRLGSRCRTCGCRHLGSVNGMVRSCSCPASKRSWQGAPKTRSTPCLRHPIPRSP